MSRITTSRPSAFARSMPSRTACTGSRPLVGVDRDVDLRAELDQLLDRRGALEVGGDERGLLAVLREQQRELAGGGRLAGALEAGEQDHRRRRGEKASFDAPAPISSVSSSWTIFTTCWPGVRLLATSCAERALADARDELLDDLEVDVRLEQREADLAHRARDRLLVERSARRGGRRGRSGACPKGCRTPQISVLTRFATSATLPRMSAAAVRKTVACSSATSSARPSSASASIPSRCAR